MEASSDKQGEGARVPPHPAKAGGAMPKLPARPGAQKPKQQQPQQDTDAATAPTQPSDVATSGQGLAAPSVATPQPAAASGSGNSDGLPNGDAAGTPPPAASMTPAETAAAPAAGKPVPAGLGSGGSGGGLPGRPSAAGPSLPPRTARKPADSSAAASAPAGAPAPSAAAASTAPAAPAPKDAAASPATGGTAGGGRKAPSGGLSALPPRGGLLPLPAVGPVLDPDEPEAVAEVRRSIHAVRVQMISAALRLGYDHENALVKQVLYRLALAEKLKAPWRRPGKRPDPVAAAAREAARAVDHPGTGSGPGSGSGSGSVGLTDGPQQAGQAAARPLGFTVKIMLIGLRGSGKTQLAHALLGPTDPTGPEPQAADPQPASSPSASASQPAPASPQPGRHAAVHPFSGATRRVGLLRGSAAGIGLEFVDTPGLALGPGGAADNCRVLQQIRRAYSAHRPDLLLYVDRLDAPPPSGPGGPGVPPPPGGGGGELAVLRELSAALGPGMWLNTILAFSHAGSPPPSAPRGGPTGRPPSFEQWLDLRSQALQLVIRQASSDERLMNPVAFAESHPACALNAAGQPVIHNGMPWRSHLLLMLTCAKLLSDTEALLQRQGGPAGAAGAGAGGGAGLGALLGGGDVGGARQVPLSYIMQQLTQMSRPLKFPDQRAVMDVRRARHEAARLVAPRQRREAARQVSLRVLGLRQAARRGAAMADAYRRGSAAGCKVTPEPPRIATRCRPSAMPAENHRYRAPEASGGWVVRPHVESHCADSSDGVEGFVLNKVAVAARRAGEEDGLGGAGVPYHHYLSAQVTKDQKLLAARSEATLYHDPLGAATTSLSLDMQTSATAQPPAAAAGGAAPGADVLLVLRSDTRLRGRKGSGWPKVTLGAVAARVGEEARLPLPLPGSAGRAGVPVPLPLRGPSALGLRMQAVKKGTLGPGAAPLRLALAAAALQRTSELSAGRIGLAPLAGLARNVGGALRAAWRRRPFRGAAAGGAGTAPSAAAPPPPLAAADMDSACLGASLELTTDLADLLDLPLTRRLPGALGAAIIRSPEGDTSAQLTTSMQYRLGPREVVALRGSWDGRGRAGLNFRIKSVSGWWVGLLAMLVPLGRLALGAAADAVRTARARRKLRRLRQQQAERAAAVAAGVPKRS